MITFFFLVIDYCKMSFHLRKRHPDLESEKQFVLKNNAESVVRSASISPDVSVGITWEDTEFALCN